MDNIKCSNLNIIWNTERQDKEDGAGEIFKEMMAGNFFTKINEGHVSEKKKKYKNQANKNYQYHIHTAYRKSQKKSLS